MLPRYAPLCITKASATSRAAILYFTTRVVETAEKLRLLSFWQKSLPKSHEAALKKIKLGGVM